MRKPTVMVVGPIDVAESTLFRLAQALPETKKVVEVAFLPPPPQVWVRRNDE